MDYNIDDILKETINSNKFSKTSSGLMLTESEKSVLDKYHINYDKCGTLKELLFEIETVFSEDTSSDLDDLDYISSKIAERDYYQNSNK